jgi:N-alpha-acetyl-L-2,4-diaminobutyrate deacetylase
MMPNPITSTIPFERDGVHHGHLRLPYSRDESAWGSVMIPLTVVRNGEGQTALLTGANHGDEYEGPVALFDLALGIDLSAVSGRIIIIPAMNYPAFRAGTRTSPINGGNMNRAFPGDPRGSVTAKIADYFQRTLLPMSDFVLDIHTGGKTLDFVPFAAAHILEDKTQQAACVAAMQAFNAPYSVMLLEIDSVGMYDTAAEELGKIFVSTELGGAGTARARSNAIAKKGVRNFLIHAGILAGEAETTPSRMLDMPGGECFTFAEHEGLIECCADLATPVNSGDILAKIWPVERSGVTPALYRAKMNGIGVSRHIPSLIKMGDCLAVIAHLDEAGQ